MLNKLAYFKSNPGIPPIKQDAGIYRKIADAFAECWINQGISASLAPGPSGTLGVTFLCTGLPEGTRFVKTHLPGDIYRAALEREYVLLTAANPSDFSIRATTLEVHGLQQLYLDMDVLKDSVQIDPALACSLISGYQARLQPLKGLYGLEYLHAAAAAELPILQENGFFDTSASTRCARLLDTLKEQIPSMTRCVCHGDFGDRNIMMDCGQSPVVIDWEDAFWGCRDYDFLYWMTFFNHRKYYLNPDLFDSVSDPVCILPLLTMILIIKSAISFYSGTYHGNSVTMQDRLLEIWEIGRDLN